MFESGIKLKSAVKKKLPILKIRSKFSAKYKQPLTSRFRYTLDPLAKEKRQSKLLTSITSPSKPTLLEDNPFTPTTGSPKQGCLRKTIQKPFKSPKTLLPFPPRLDSICYKRIRLPEDNEVSFGRIDDRFDGSANIFKS